MTKPDRDQRLAAKLRENLRRRKMQAKARSVVDPAPEEQELENNPPEPVPPKSDANGDA